MAEYEERNLDDLTEEPSQHKLDELRKKGQTTQSRELTGAVVLLGVMAAIYLISQNFVGQFTGLMKEVFTKDILRAIASNHAETPDWSAYTDLGYRCGKLMLFAFLPVAGCGAILGILTSFAQTGFNVTTDVLMPDLERLNPMGGLGRVFSVNSLIEGFKSVLKFTVISLAVYTSVKTKIFGVPNTVAMESGQILSFIGTITTKIFGVTMIFLFLTAAFDYFIQWRKFRKQAMMTKQEAKQEMKEREGDPQMKARIRTIQRERARKRMMTAVPKADVIITNPTHFAVAIIYDLENGIAPKVVAKGADFMAQKIKQIAKENNVPMVENVPLARSLYKHVKVGQMIPRSLYQAVAEVLAYVYKLRGRKPKQAAEKVVSKKPVRKPPQRQNPEIGI